MAFLFVLFFACNLFDNLQAEDPGKQEEVFSEEGAGLREPSENDGAGITKDNGVKVGENRLRGGIRDEDENPQDSRKRRQFNGCVRRRRNDPGWYMCCHVKYRRAADPADCCRYFRYDHRRSICCGGIVQSKPSGRSACCLTKAYSVQWQICCGEIVQTKPRGSPACCRTRAYDSNECICCAGRVRIKPAGSNSRCCRTQAYNALSQTCCRGTVKSKRRVSPECCGTRPFDSGKYMCCGDNLQRILAVHSECCGTYAYDYEKDMCRGGIIRSRPPGTAPEW